MHTSTGLVVTLINSITTDVGHNNRLTNNAFNIVEMCPTLKS